MQQQFYLFVRFVFICLLGFVKKRMVICWTNIKEKIFVFRAALTQHCTRRLNLYKNQDAIHLNVSMQNGAEELSG